MYITMSIFSMLNEDNIVIKNVFKMLENLREFR